METIEKTSDLNTQFGVVLETSASLLTHGWHGGWGEGVVDKRPSE